MPSGITADYSAEFFAALNADASGGSELDRGNEEIVASVNTTIESRYNGSGNTSIHSISESTAYMSGILDVSKVGHTINKFFDISIDKISFCSLL